MGNITTLDLLLSRVTPMRTLPTITRTVRNWQDVVFFRFNIKKSVTLTLRSGKKFKIANREDYYRFMNVTMDWAIEQAKLEPNIKIEGKRIKSRFLGKEVIFECDSKEVLGTSARLAVQQFVEQEYGPLRVEGKVVVDVGATIADASMYFVIRGASHVYAIEPSKHSYAIARRNVQLNGMGKKITLLNSAISGRPKLISTLGSDITRTDSCFEKSALPKEKDFIKALTIKEIVDTYGIDGGVLKMDCEGCEYDSILGASESTLRKFGQIVIEYHRGYIDLVEKLEKAGFRTAHTIPRYGAYHNTHCPDMYMGLLFADRI